MKTKSKSIKIRNKKHIPSQLELAEEVERIRLFRNNIATTTNRRCMVDNNQELLQEEMEVAIYSEVVDTRRPTVSLISATPGV